MDLGRRTAIRTLRHESDAGMLEAWEAVPQLFVCRVEGRMETGHADTWVQMADLILGRGQPIIGVFDWLRMEAYESQARKRLTAWGLRHRPNIHEVHIAHSSPLVRMGVSVANIVLGGLIEAHGDIETLSARYTEIVERCRREGPPRTGDSIRSAS